MFLKKIELNGFKSFSNRKELLINNGITGIVGPNGSGKSNIADAMRWVLGEQSSKNLRGVTMQDVIFNGTQKLNKKGYCEVSLTFDNTSDKLNLGFSEICVKRKMYRSGESEYYINNSLCRLYDILDLFRDTGIGKEGYSIIGQGRIEDILSSKPLQRRQVFEEAAGISKYRSRKEEAERNLQKTADNITRIDDILTEIDSQLIPLEKQMHDAKSFVSLRERLKILETNIFLYQYNQTEERIWQAERQYSEKAEELADVEKRIELYTSNENKLIDDLEILQKTINNYNVKFNELACEKERQKGELAVEEQKEVHCSEQLKEINKQIAHSIGAVKQNISEIKTQKKLLMEQSIALAKNESEISKYTNQSQENKAAGDLIKKINKMEEQYKELEASGNALCIKQNEALIKANLVDNSIKELQSKIDGYELSCKKLNGCINILQIEIDENSKNSAALKEKIIDCKNNITIVHRELESANNELRQLNRNIDERSSRLEILSDIEKNHDGYFESVKALLSAANSDQSISGLICGVVAECIDTPKHFETAIEVVLGGALQNIIVKRPEDAKTIIAFLRKSNIGRITFLPLEALKIKYLAQKDKDLLTEKGILGIASELVKCDAHLKPAIDFLLARTVLARDMDCGLHLAKKAGFAFRIATVEGEIINSGGTITGGVIKRPKTGILNRKRFGDELKIEIGEFKSKINKLKEDIGIKRSKEKALNEEQEKLEKQLHFTELCAVETRQKLIAAESNLDNENIAFDAARNEADRNMAEHSILIGQLSVIENDIKNNEDELNRLNIEINNAKKEYEKTNKSNEDIKDLIGQLESENMSISHKIDMITGEKERLRNLIVDTKTLFNKQINRRKELKTDALKIIRNKDSISSQISEIDSQLESGDKRIKEKLDYRDRLQEQKHIERELLREAAKLREELTEQKYKLKSVIDKNRQNSENIQHIIWENHKLTYANAKKLALDDFSYKAGVEEAELIKSNLADLGAINPNAIEEYNRVKLRYDALCAQRSDLMGAQNDLKVIIDNLLTGMTMCFKEKIALINKNFGSVFAELFGGGLAEVKLLDESDAMASGIDIIAQPPGKKLQSISLLSGGEKALTAIALLFAMLKINPSPICLLDEIDAPLDDANLTRFSEYLCKLTSDSLQFIVITHRKPTMAVCDTLYGVAMHEKGVSDIVSVSIG